jgi:hypothetical protein
VGEQGKSHPPATRHSPPATRYFLRSFPMLAFVHIEKCAGQTVHGLLRSTYGLRHCDVLPWQGYAAMDALQGITAADIRRLQPLFPALKSIAGHKVRIYSDLDTLFPNIRYFALIREPLKRYASHYQFIKQRRGLLLDFEAWVATNDWGANWQTRMLTGAADINEAIRFLQRPDVLVGLVERFDESLVLAKGLLDGNLDIAYERRNVATDNSLAHEVLHSPRTRPLLIEQNQADLALYDYVKNDLYPTYRRIYGRRLAQDLADFQARQRGFNRWNLTQAQIHRNAVYKTAVRLYRRRHGIQEKVI